MTIEIVVESALKAWSASVRFLYSYNFTISYRFIASVSMMNLDILPFHCDSYYIMVAQYILKISVEIKHYKHTFSLFYNIKSV